MNFNIIRSLSPAVPTEIYDTYWRFAVERQEIFYRRLNHSSLPLTDDPILLKYKFTNAYRASDRTSQYLIRNVIYTGEQTPDELFFRIILFKIFNKIPTWELLKENIGEILYATYSFEQYDEVLTKALDQGIAIFSSAYIMPSGSKYFRYSRKHRNYLKVLESMIADNIPYRIHKASSMRYAFDLIRSFPMIGDFLAYQYLIDLNYSILTNFSEMEFIVPGPGARSGIKKCFSSLGGLNEVDIIRLVTERQQYEFDRLEIQFQSLWGRPLQLIDCQNLFCEIDKYARVAYPHIKGIGDRTKIKQKYHPTAQTIPFWYPPKWNINHLI